MTQDSIARWDWEGGTTAAALDVLAMNDVRRHFIDAVKAAAARARELGDALGKD